MRMLPRLKDDHSGWIGTPNRSDFDSVWGIISIDDILDCSKSADMQSAVRRALDLGFAYFINPFPSKDGCQLYRVTKKRPPIGRCVYALARYDKTRAEHSRLRYSTDLSERVKMLLRAIRWRATRKGIPFDLSQANILARFQMGRCEATGLPFDFGVRRKNPFAPSLDQIVPSAGYTTNNVQVVCLLYNIIKSAFPEDNVTRVFLALAQCKLMDLAERKGGTVQSLEPSDPMYEFMQWLDAS